MHFHAALAPKMSSWHGKLSQFSANICSPNKVKHVGRSHTDAENKAKCSMSLMISGRLTPMAMFYYIETLWECMKCASFQQKVAGLHMTSNSFIKRTIVVLSTESNAVCRIAE